MFFFLFNFLYFLNWWLQQIMNHRTILGWCKTECFLSPLVGLQRALLHDTKTNQIRLVLYSLSLSFPAILAYHACMTVPNRRRAIYFMKLSMELLQQELYWGNSSTPENSSYCGEWRPRQRFWVHIHRQTYIDYWRGTPFSLALLISKGSLCEGGLAS
jgi:hypothetical protein